MKRVILVIVGLAGVGGLAALLMYHPQNGASTGAGGAVPLQAQSSPTPAPASGTPSGTSPATSTSFKDGTYTGETVDVSYGPVQVQAVISGGKISAVNVLQMPSDSDHAVQLASESKPLLVQEALAAQSSNVDVVSGATLDSEGFSQSLQSALSHATST